MGVIQFYLILTWISVLHVIQWLPQKGFGSADSVQRDRYIMCIVSQTPDPNPFQGAHCTLHILPGSDSGVNLVYLKAFF